MTAQMKPNHHPCCNTLFRYAQGTLSPAMQLLVAAHLNYCPHCRQELQSYEAEAGLGLESLPPEALDSKCLENLLSKIDENGPPACIDVTLPSCDTAEHRFPDALRGYVGAKGENIKWDYTFGHAQWIVPMEMTSKTRLLCLDAHFPMRKASLSKDAILLVLDGTLSAQGKNYHKGDIIRATHLGNSTTATESLYLIVVPEKKDKPNWWQCLMALVGGDKN